MATHINTDVDDEIDLLVNAYLDNATWKYKTDGAARRIKLDSAGIYFERAASGSADGTITWLRDATITAAGQFCVGQQTSLHANMIIQINDTTQFVTVGGVRLKTNSANIGNVGAGEDNLFNITTLMSALKENNDSLHYEFWGTTANNANVKTLRLKLGTSGVTTLFSRVMTPSAANVWRLQGTLHRTTQTTQKAISTMVDGGVVENQSVTNLNQDLLAAGLAFKLTAEATADNDITLIGWNIRWEPHE